MRLRLLSAVLVLVALVGAACRDGGGEPPERKLTGATFELVAFGDFGSGAETEHEVARAVERWVIERGADALVTTGDNIYPHGAPASFETAWHEPYGWVEERDLPVLASLGNHDVETDKGRPVMDLYDMPARYYSEVIGDAEVFVLDGNRVANPAQLEWLRDALEGSDSAWQIAAFHQPPFSCSDHGNAPRIIDTWVPLFEELGVDLVLTGHDHNYQRFEERNGVTYVVTGGGGHVLYEIVDCAEGTPEHVATNDENHHFLSVIGNAQILRVTAITSDDETIDRFDLQNDG